MRPEVASARSGLAAADDDGTSPSRPQPANHNFEFSISRFGESGCQAAAIPRPHRRASPQSHGWRSFVEARPVDNPAWSGIGSDPKLMPALFESSFMIRAAATRRRPPCERCIILAASINNTSDLSARAVEMPDRILLGSRRLVYDVPDRVLHRRGGGRPLRPPA